MHPEAAPAHLPARSRAGRGRAALALLAATVALAVTGAAGPAASPPASAAEVETAGTCDGVWVVVDARELGGSVTTRCAPGDPPSGLAALEGSGHSYTFVPRVPGMVCTIDGRPDPCNGAPADAYWSYWHAEAGGSWTYSSTGAGSRDPQPGEVEGWAFGAGEPPGTHPPAPDPENGDADAGDSDGDDEAGGDGGGHGDGVDGGSSSTGASDDGAQGPSGGDDTTGAGTGTDDDRPVDGDGTTSTTEAGTDTDDARAARGDEAEPADERTAGSARDGDDADEEDEDEERVELDETPGDANLAGEPRKVVELAAPPENGRGGAWRGVAVGTALAGALAGATAWQVRRRRLTDAP